MTSYIVIVRTCTNAIILLHVVWALDFLYKMYIHRVTYIHILTLSIGNPHTLPFIMPKSFLDAALFGCLLICLFMEELHGCCPIFTLWMLQIMQYASIQLIGPSRPYSNQIFLLYGGFPLKTRPRSTKFGPFGSLWRNLIPSVSPKIPVRCHPLSHQHSIT
jgi:hypothetical protein